MYVQKNVLVLAFARRYYVGIILIMSSQNDNCCENQHPAKKYVRITDSRTCLLLTVKYTKLFDDSWYVTQSQRTRRNEQNENERMYSTAEAIFVDHVT